MSKIKAIIFVALFSGFKLISDSSVDYEKLVSDTYSKDSLSLIWADGAGQLDIGYLNRSEGFYSRGTSYLSDSLFDQQSYFQNTSDLKFYVKQGDALRSRLVIRNKFRVAEPESIGKISDSSIKLADAPTEGTHSHYLGKLFFWIREAWVEAYLNDVFNLNCKTKHYFKFGLLPFSLGRGISLSDAYLVSPGVIGFYSNNVIDQYAFGMLLHGDLICPTIEYDLYFALLKNNMGSFKDVTAKTFERDFERFSPYRGFGSINFLFASRVIGTISNPLGCKGKARIEPYFMINSDPEQKIEFDADAASKLATLGLALEYEGEKYSWGVETAANFGHQIVRAWDRNEIKLVNKDGNAIFQYTKVLTGSNTGPKAIVNTANKAAVNDAPRGTVYNGLEIDSSGLYNAIDRFTQSYENSYKGVMFVVDFTAALRKNVKLSTAFAYASGDKNPNKDQFEFGDSEIDGDFQGFIPFMSNYSGRSVASAFFLGMGRIARPSNVASVGESKDAIANIESGFTNLILYGIGSDMLVDICSKKTRIRPNILFGWQANPTNKFDFVAKKSLEENADRYLGFEVNLFSEMELIKNLKGFLVSGIFFPGNHFRDIKGKPLTSDQADILKNNTTICGNDLFDKNSLPLLNNKKAFIINIGLEYSF